MAFGAYARACSVSPCRRTQRSPVRSRRCPATVVPSPDGRARSPGQTREIQTLEARAVRRSIRPQTHLVLPSTRRNRWLLRSKRRNFHAHQGAGRHRCRPLTARHGMRRRRRRRRRRRGRRTTVASAPAATSPDTVATTPATEPPGPATTEAGDRPGPVEDHLAVADGDRDAVRDRCRRPGDRRRQLLELPAGGGRQDDRALGVRAERRGDRRLRARPRRHRRHQPGVARAARLARHRPLGGPGGDHARRRLRADRATRRRDRSRRRGGRAGRPTCRPTSPR